MSKEEVQSETTPATVPASTGAAPKPPLAWQPLTPRGVAAFAPATCNRILLVQLIVALLAGATILWFLSTGWFPTVREAIQQLPETGAIQGLELHSPRESASPLAESRFLAFIVNVADGGNTPSRADLRVEFHQKNIQLCSVIGCLVLDYPTNHEFNRPELEPLWGAWEPILLGLFFVATVAFLFLCWTVLATLYFPFVRALAYFKDRQLTLAGSWRIAAAALMPGALLLTLGLFLYGLGVLDLIGLVLLIGLHVIAPWIFLILSPLTLPRVAAALPPSANPFAAPPPPPEQAPEQVP